MDAAYVEIARERVRAATPAPDVRAASIVSVAGDALRDAGFSDVRRHHRVRDLGLTLAFVARDGRGREWYFDLTGAFTTTRSGLARADVTWRALGRAHALAQVAVAPLVLLTSSLPAPRSEAGRALAAARGASFVDAVALGDDEAVTRLAHLASSAIG
jgi:hypothetical protein